VPGEIARLGTANDTNQIGQLLPPRHRKVTTSPPVALKT
jgi:hypothetical protein